MLLELAWRSLWNRRGSVLLTLLSITLSVFTVIGVEHIRSQARESFSRTISGVDLVVGARTSQLNLLLYSVFRIGNASNGVSWPTYAALAADKRVAWSIPLSLGDSHRGYRVLGTTSDYFTHFRYGAQTPLELREGQVFGEGNEVVLGATVAARLGYQLGDELVLAHGLGEVSFSNHDDAPFTVTGILAATGTPVDQTLHISLHSMEAIHASLQNATAHTEPESITAFLVGLKSRAAVFGLQREINDLAAEPLTAILPGVALAELWSTMAAAEAVLSAISALVLLASLLGMATLLLSSMKERTREIALYRAVGAHASTILLLIELECLLITCMGMAAGFLLVWAGLLAGQDWLSEHYGLVINTFPLNGTIATYLAVILVGAVVLAGIPGVTAYRSSLAGKLRLGA